MNQKQQGNTIQLCNEYTCRIPGAKGSWSIDAQHNQHGYQEADAYKGLRHICHQRRSHTACQGVHYGNECRQAGCQPPLLGMLHTQAETRQKRAACRVRFETSRHIILRCMTNTETVLQLPGVQHVTKSLGKFASCSHSHAEQPH